MATSKQLLAKMHRMLEQDANYARMSDGERAAESELDQAELEIDLQNDDKALALLAKSSKPRARYLDGHIARLRHHWAKMEKAFSRLSSDRFSDDVSMERAHALFFHGNYERLRKRLVAFPSKSLRFTEAQYYLGLALYHLGKKREARALWKRRIESAA